MSAFALVVGIGAAALVAPGAAQAYEELAAFIQAEARDADGRVIREAAAVHVIACNGEGENGGNFHVYQFIYRDGFRVVRPPEWGVQVGGMDYATYAEAIDAACHIALDEGPGPETEDTGTDLGPGTADLGPQRIGCFADQGGKRDLNRYKQKTADNSPEVCVAACAERGFLYAGLQNGDECFCGNRYGSYGAAENCDRPCAGDAAATCGGIWANEVWATGIEAP